MNQKDYKEIAGILKQSYISWKNAHDSEPRTNVLSELRMIANSLASYFEKEDRKDYYKTHNPKYDLYFVGCNKFSKEQFLKDFGIVT